MYRALLSLMVLLVLCPVRGMADDAPRSRAAGESACLEDERPADASPAAAPAVPEPAGEPAAEAAGDAGVDEEPWGPLAILGRRIEPGTKKQMKLPLSESFAGVSLPTPVTIVRGARPGPSLCITAGVHGDELNGVEVARRVLARVEPDELRGTLIGTPIVNPHAFRRGSRYLPDRRDLNRYFPGNPRGSTASRIAFTFFDGVVRLCDALVDLHSGSMMRTNLQQVRADLENEDVVALARRFGTTTVIHNRGRPGTLRRAACDAGIPAITIEAGEPMRFQKNEVVGGVLAVETLLQNLGMMAAEEGGPFPVAAQQLYYVSHWVRADDGGILLTQVGLGDRVSRGDVLGSITDPISNETAVVVSPVDGRVIGMALDQLVIPGFAAFHVALDHPNGDGTADDERETHEEGDGLGPPEVDDRPE